jgi:4-hydroxy-tetrahydrodipicolinate reductase
MGAMVEQAGTRAGLEVACVIDPVAGSRGRLGDCEVAVDFSEPGAVMDNIKTVAAARISMVVGTTGWYDRIADARHLVEEAGIGFVYGSNFSVGVNLMFMLTERAAELFSRFAIYDPFIEEAHHKFKKDAPSGTAMFLKRIVESEYQADVPTSSTRAGYIPGSHTVGFDSEADTLTITHVARNRAGFAEGALLAAKWIKGRTGFFEFSEVMAHEMTGNQGSNGKHQRDQAQ